MSDEHEKNNKYGFEFGAASVSRNYSRKGHVTISVETRRGRQTIRVTPTGIVRTWWTKGSGEKDLVCQQAGRCKSQHKRRCPHSKPHSHIASCEEDACWDGPVAPGDVGCVVVEKGKG